MKKKWVPANYLVGRVKQTPRSSVPDNKDYNMDSGANDKEIEIGTTAESLELRFFVYLFVYLFLFFKTDSPGYPIQKI